HPPGTRLKVRTHPSRLQDRPSPSRVHLHPRLSHQPSTRRNRTTTPGANPNGPCVKSRPTPSTSNSTPSTTNRSRDDTTNPGGAYRSRSHVTSSRPATGSPVPAGAHPYTGTSTGSDHDRVAFPYPSSTPSTTVR